MAFEYPDDCIMMPLARVEIVDASFGIENSCTGFGPRTDSRKTPENVARWNAALEICGRQALTGCSDCPTREFLTTIEQEVDASEG